MNTNDWGDSQDINEEEEEEKWDDFNTPTQAPVVSSTTTTTKSSSGYNASAWAQEKPAAKSNDWDTDAFFDDVISTTAKSKLKTTRRS